MPFRYKTAKALQNQGKSGFGAVKKTALRPDLSVYCRLHTDNQRIGVEQIYIPHVLCNAVNQADADIR